MTGRGKKAAVPKKKANGYQMPAPIATGEVIHDSTMKKKWRIGHSIGVGGFGEIYSACDHETTPKDSNYPFVVKIEPHANGPLFVENHFYIRNAKLEDIKSYMKNKKLSSLGMPSYYGKGSHEYKGQRYRYLVLERYGKDLWTLFMENGKLFPPTTVFQIGLQMLDVLEYIHSRGYVHADIKGGNILLGRRPGSENQAYLVDFGLAARVGDKEFKPDPKCAHNGTIEYTSRDAHLGVATMRGDLEILGYNMLQWMAGELPWEKSLKQPKAVQEAKETFMKTVRTSVTKLLPGAPEALIKFFEYINTLKPKDVPDYAKCRQIFEAYLKSEGVTSNSKLVFSPGKKNSPSKKKTKVTAPVDDGDYSEEEVPRKRPQKNGDATKVKKGKKPKEASSEDEYSEEVVPRKRPQKNDETTKAKKDRKPKETSSEDDYSEEKIPRKRPPKQNGEATKVKRGRKPIELSSDENGENEEPVVKAKTVKRRVKRKSMEPSVVVTVKKTKLVPKATPPVKKNHADMGTQTSVEKTRRSPRQVSFDSPVCATVGEDEPLKTSKSADSSGDIFDESFVLEGSKATPKKKLLSEKKYTVTKEVRRKVTTVKPKGKSWKEMPSVANGRPPPH